MKTISILLFIGCLASASTHEEAKSRAEKAKGQVISELESLKFGEAQKLAIRGLVNTGIKILREEGQEQMANELASQWQTHEATLSSEINSDNLGDHRPIWKWLADFYNKVESVVGEKILHFMHLDDIKTFNFAPIVVFQPKGDPKFSDSWDKPEYQRHFVPYAGASVYWSSKTACDMASSGILNYFCGTIATVLRFGTEKLVAPPMSDAVYDKFAKRN